MSISLCESQKRNRTEKQIDIYGVNLMFMSRDLLMHFVEDPQPQWKGLTVLNSQRYWNGSGKVMEWFWN